MNPKSASDRELPAQLLARCTELGVPDRGYLQTHLTRFVQTLRCARAQGAVEGETVLDIGAHWLHQSLLWQLAGAKVIAADLPITLDDAELVRIAGALNIELHAYDRLDQGNALRGIADNRIDTLLFCEILEHITFNPTLMWREFYRVLKPGGRIIVTTPNFYDYRKALQQLWHALSGQGAGIRVADIFHTPTFGHHWKEYSQRELHEYFRLLSPDFQVQQSRQLPRHEWLSAYGLRRKFQACLESLLLGFRPNLYLEVRLIQKRKGITDAGG